MKLICDRAKLLEAFQTASAVVPARSPKPILQNVKIEADNGTVVLMATDLEIGVRAELGGVVVEQPGQAVLPSARLGLILRENQDEKVTLVVEGDAVLVRGERSEFRLPSESPDEFPPVATFQETRYHEVPARLLRELIRRTVFATDTESTRYALGGVLLELEADKIVAVGTDGRRLATMEGPASAIGGSEAGDNQPIVPTKAMHLIERAIADNTTEIRLAARANQVLVKSERATIVSRLVEGRFPRWRDVFPKREGAVRIELPVGALYATVRQAAIVTNEESRGVLFGFDQGRVVLSSRAANLGQSRIELPIAYQGPELSIMLDPRYFTDFLRVLDAEKTFTLELKDAESAAVCSTDDGYSYVIMPLARDA